MTANPSASLPAVEGSPTPDLATQPVTAIAREVFLAWEKLRVVYVAVLATVTLVLIESPLAVTSRLAIDVVVGALAANVLYFAGPLTESYLRWLGYDRGWPRWALFLGGTMLAVVFAVGLLAPGLLQG